MQVQVQKNIMDITMDKMIDIHTHILPGVDDGAKTIDESLKIIEYLKKVGITDIVLTSHYIKNTNYTSNRKEREQLFHELKEQSSNMGINLYLGNEVYLTEDILDLLEQEEIVTLNDTKYMLVELPLTGYLNNLPNILCKLFDSGIVPIIAHPERYHFLQKNKERVKELLEFGCLLQCNIDSITGKYGKKAKKLMKWLLKKDLVEFVATDTHYVEKKRKLKKSLRKLKRFVGKKKLKELIKENPLKMLKGEEIQGNLEYLIEEERNRN